jgi:outer membrane lipoprotein SlyB
VVSERSSFGGIDPMIVLYTVWKKLMQKLAFIAVLRLLTSACATRQQSTSTAVGATAGAVVGGPVGAVVDAGAGAVAGAPGGIVDEVQGDNRRRVVRRR